MDRKKTNRRNFIKNSSLALLAAPVLGKKTLYANQETVDPDEIPKIKNHKTLGRTGFKVSDIASGSPRSEAVLKVLLKSGVNYIDTVCKECQGYCEEACPYGVITRSLMSIAHQNLSLDQESFA